MLHRQFGPLIPEPTSAECAAAVPRLEFYSIRPGPDGLSRNTRRLERRGGLRALTAGRVPACTPLQRRAAGAGGTR